MEHHILACDVNGSRPRAIRSGVMAEESAESHGHLIPANRLCSTACGFHAHVKSPRWLQLNRLCSTVAQQALQHCWWCCQRGRRARPPVAAILELCSIPAVAYDFENVSLTLIDLDVFRGVITFRSKSNLTSTMPPPTTSCLTLWHGSDKPIANRTLLCSCRPHRHHCRGNNP